MVTALGVALSKEHIYPITMAHLTNQPTQPTVILPWEVDIFLCVVVVMAFSTTFR